MNRLIDVSSPPSVVQRVARRRQKKIAQQQTSEHRRILWEPLPGPQTMAFNSQADILGYGGAAGGGKALALDTPLPMPRGWVTMGDVQVGDTLFDEGGQPCQVKATSHVMCNHTCYEVVFSDGSVIVADADHNWLTMNNKECEKAARRTPEFRLNRRQSRPRRGKETRPDLAIANSERDYNYLEPPSGAIRTTQEIADTLKVSIRTNHSIAVCDQLDLPEVDLLIPPYVLGAWLGDGSSYKAEITTADPEILEAIGEHYKTAHRADYTYGIYNLLTDLKKLKVITNKHIPPVYLRSSPGQRLALLQGLMDTDGYCDKRGQCEFTATNEVLAIDVHELLGTLGIKAAISEGRATLYGKDCGPKYRIKFLTDMPAFRLTRKLKRQKREGFRGTHNQRYITDVRPIPSVPVRCVAVDSESHLYLAGSSFIPTHNTDLLLGLGATQHQRAVIFRQVFPSLRGIIERSREIFNPGGVEHARDSYNESLHRWVLGSGKMLEFESCQYEKDREKQRGRPRDFYGFDEVTEFSKTKVEFITAWNRSVNPEQRCRVVMTFNPPSDELGSWVTDYFLPWLAFLHPDQFTHPHPAEPGELRWFATIEGQQVELESGEPFADSEGDMIRPLSRTFIPAKLKDNPYLNETNYRSILQSLPEPFRSQMLDGDFAAMFEADPWQVIPTMWIKAAMMRRAEGEPTVALSGLAIDVARGGKDRTVLSKRYGNRFPPLKMYPGRETPNGPTVAAKAVDEIGEEEPDYINVDVIGVGSSAYDSLDPIYKHVNPINVAEKSTYVDKSKKFRMRNQRSEMFWRLREALDPAHGDDIELPDDTELLADLAAPRYSVSTAGILIEEKEAIKSRIGRSPDKGESIALHFLRRKKGVFFG